MRVFSREDISAAEAYFVDRGIHAVRCEVPFQGDTLRVRDPAGIYLELCAEMETRPRLHHSFHAHRGGAARRFDHYQVFVPDVAAAAVLYLSLGFAVADYAFTPDGRVVGAFLHRKNNPHDIVLIEGTGPAVQHFAYVTDHANLMRTADAAASLGLGHCVEWGPGTHGQGHASFLYLRDPDGHRVELLSHPIQTIDPEEKPNLWDITRHEIFVPWGPDQGQFRANDAILESRPALGDLYSCGKSR